MKIKSYTDLEQSKKLTEILPFESADMHYSTWTILDGEFIVSPNQGSTIKNLQEDYGNQIIPCWSLAALINILPIVEGFGEEIPHLLKFGDKWMCKYVGDEDDGMWRVADNSVDACYEMILKLHELKLL